MNDLNSQQIVLLCLLVSFVSSIATGITTVSLLDQSPEQVSQTINRVVEKTIERVIETPQEKEDKTRSNNSNNIERIVETVVVNQEDLTVDAVNKNSKSLARLYSIDGFGKRTFIGLGIVVDELGRIVVENSIGEFSKVVAVFENGETSVRYLSGKSPFAIYEVIDIQNIKLSPAILSDSQNLKLAQTVILLSGRQHNVVSTGIITDLISIDGEITPEDIENDSQSKKIITSINASVDVNKVLVGSILLNLQGEIVGVKMGSGSAETTTFLPVNNLKTFLAGLTN